MKLEHNKAKQAKLNLLINLISMSFSLVIMVYGGGRLMIKTLETGQISPSLGIEMGLVYAAIPLCGVFMLVYITRDIFENISIAKKSPTSSNS